MPELPREQKSALSSSFFRLRGGPCVRLFPTLGPSPGGLLLFRLSSELIAPLFLYSLKYSLPLGIFSKRDPCLGPSSRFEQYTSWRSVTFERVFCLEPCATLNAPKMLNGSMGIVESRRKKNVTLFVAVEVFSHVSMFPFFPHPLQHAPIISSIGKEQDQTICPINGTLNAAQPSHACGFIPTASLDASH